jgi:hypothetical protein
MAITSFLLKPAVVVAASLAGVGALRILEGHFATVPFALAVLALIASLLFLATRRPRASVLAAWGLVALVAVVSFTKQRLMGMNAHVFDVLFLRDLETARFVVVGYWPMLLPVAAALAAAVWAAVRLFRAEPPMPVGAPSRVAVGAAAALLVPATNVKSADDHSYYTSHHFATAFFASIGDAGTLLTQIPLVQSLAAAPAAAKVDATPTCTPSGEQPDVVVIHMESVFPTSLYPDWKTGPADRFLGVPGRDWRPLKVETFAGASWTTTAGLFAGLPVAEFGWMRPYLPIFMENRIRSSLPRTLEACGYRTVALMPTRYAMVNEGPFLRSLGFQEVYDRDAMGAASWNDHDTVYYDFARKLIAEHRAGGDGRPLMLFVQTMGAHSPYDTPKSPEIEVEGAPFGNEPIVDEFLRRVAIAVMDRDRFLGGLAAAPGGNGTVVLEFGDHQPAIAVGAADALHGGGALADWDSPAYRTYYAVHGYGREIGPLPDVPVLDAGYLGATFAEAAGLPTDGVLRALTDLRNRCGGAYRGCADRGAVLAHLRGLVDAGLLVLSGPVGGPEG